MGPWPIDRFCLAGYGRGHVCSLGTTLTKYFRKDKWVSQRYECSVMTLSNGNICRVTGPLWGEPTGVFPSQRPVTRSFNIFFICALTSDWANSRDVAGFRPHRAHRDVTLMISEINMSVWFKRNALAKAVYGRSLLNIYVRVQWVVCWKLWPWSHVRRRHQSNDIIKPTDGYPSV